MHTRFHRAAEGVTPRQQPPIARALNHLREFGVIWGALLAFAGSTFVTPNDKICQPQLPRFVSGSASILLGSFVLRRRHPCRRLRRHQNQNRQQGCWRYQTVLVSASLEMSGERIRTRGRLPHWEADRALYFVTFRLADSLPRSAFRPADDFAESPRKNNLRSRRLEEILDSGRGRCHLSRPHIARIVAQSLREFDGRRYRLLAWCVMPNHVHVVFQPINGFQLSEILHSWKSYSAQMANRVLGRKGAFWQREYYDHLIPDGEQLTRAVRYTVENPGRAGLRDWPWVYVAPGAL